ncbi:protein mono-ADP-ribosyltransferase PARP12-like isoform X1 [Acipenser ruthenus]|uniref:protein mono-ADP-ribosyltransferase PARP12-like isoform X1 n=2 Tax=Acipenser ruthenus TaxID=7906 RepID=UPI002742388C|nr:protein mono-ADP-ribosyltransferase PARP12-like isoform X1 [Acipenser ruthenus]
MSVSCLTNYVTKTICSNGGSMEYRELHRLVTHYFRNMDHTFIQILGDTSRFFIVNSTKVKTAESGLCPDSKIIAKTLVQLCNHYPEGNCYNCGRLHLCKFFVYQNCKYDNERNKCRNSHDLHSVHNSNILRANQLQGLQEAELSQLLLQNDPSLLPEVCAHYNKGNGEYGSCTFKTKCTKLHICQHFLQGNCKFGQQCKRSHKFDANAQEMLEGRGLSAELISNLPSIYNNIYTINCSTGSSAGKKVRTRESSESSISDVDSDEICLFYIRKHCSFKEKCIRVHFHLPYKWEVYNGLTWNDFPNMEEIEKAYCDPENTTSDGSPPVNFLTMTLGSAKVRRLSTASSVTKPPHFILTTEWVWYWKDQCGVWIEYGKQDDGQNVSSVNTEVLENVFLVDGDGVVPFSSGGQQYTLSFKDMYQKNLKYKTKTEVRRRPRFVSSKAVDIKIKRDSSETQSSNAMSVPSHWDQGALPKFRYKLIELSKSSGEFQHVEGLFKRTMAAATVHKIQRIQNPSLWKVFQWQKEQMKKKNGGESVDEKFLFHGTEQSLLDAICEQNFDWRICGVQGSLYGKGSYFARDALYSHNYSKTRTGTQILFVARVLVGEFTRGKSNYVRPPPKDGNNTSFYNSCVDSKSNPSIFVIFEKHQIYPEYLIEYH